MNNEAQIKKRLLRYLENNDTIVFRKERRDHINLSIAFITGTDRLNQKQNSIELLRKVGLKNRHLD
ncbi:hypothetical protein [Salipaludibacillus neizhouensis]|uniref:hypothetical protein n=1 Tax=Salipaludibacillus neizhouensis TaxID=885475 RepID=UPI0011C456ED|nr:hypothetical protein [Salipaludibacillus neizhouensis]